MTKLSVPFNITESLLAWCLHHPNGPIDLLRRKLARELQIHVGKKTRVVFHRMSFGSENEHVTEGKQYRSDR